MNIMVLYGSARPNNRGQVVANWVARELEKREDIEVDLVNAADLGLPFYNEAASPMALAAYTNPKGTAWAARVGKADAFVFVAAEYNHGYTAVMKNAIDWVGKEWANKPVTFVSYGADAGGARSVEQLKQVVLQLRMIPVVDPVKTVMFPRIYADVFDEQGEPIDKSAIENLGVNLDSIMALAERLKPKAAVVV